MEVTQLHLQHYSRWDVPSGGKGPSTSLQCCPRELTWMSWYMQTRQVFQHNLPSFLGKLLTLQGWNPTGIALPPCPACSPACQLLPAAEAARTQVCLAQQFGDSSCKGHLSFPVTTLVLSPLINTWVNTVTPGSSRSGHRDLPDGLLYGLQPRPAVGEEMEHGLQPCAGGWPLSSTYGVSSPACPCASSSCLGSLFTAGNISSRGALSHGTALLPPVCCTQAKPGEIICSSEQYPMGTDLLARPCSHSPSHQGCQSSSHPLIPTAQPLLTCPWRSSCLNLIWI